MTTGVPLTLSQTKPDFEAILLQLQLFLSSKGTWKDLLTSSTGETLLEMIAATGAFNQFAIESAAREAYLTTAVRDSSIYAISRMLGVRITRKVPAGVDVVLSKAASAATLSIPKFTAFDIDGTTFFNRDPIVFSAGATNTTARLYEGQVKVQTFAANSTPFRELYLNELDFQVSDIDLEVYLTNPTTGERELWNNTPEGIWIAEPFDKLYYDSTSGFGDTTLLFGDGNHGKLPSVGHNIEVNYVVTSGAKGNNGTSGLVVVMPSNVGITGLTTSSITGGANEKASSFYKALASNIYRARTRAVNPGDYRAIAASYPGVASVVVRAQKDIAPHDLRWMNVVRICILPQEQEQFTNVEWDDFIEWFSYRAHAAVHVHKYNPTRISVNISVELALHPTAVLASVLPEVEANIQKLFAKNLYTLGRRVAVSDIHAACMVKNVDYVISITPTSDLVAPDEYTYFSLDNLTIGTKYTERL